jgi:hypothetical protein
MLPLFSSILKPKNFLHFELSLRLKVILERTSWNTIFPKYAAEGGIPSKIGPSKKDFKNFFQRLSHPFQGLPTKIMITDSTIIIRIMIEDTVFIVLLKHHSQASQPSIAAKPLC